MRAMRESERRARLVEHLRVDGRASVAELASSLDVTPSTIRRDLQRLARDGRLVRTYGGAALNDGLLASRAPTRASPPSRPSRAPPRGSPRTARRSRSASGTTALALAREIADRRLDGHHQRARCRERPARPARGSSSSSSAASSAPRMHSMLGHLAELALDASCAPTRCSWASARSASDAGPDERLRARDPRRTARCAGWRARCVVLADASKFEQAAPGFVFGLDEVDTLVTDDGARPETLAAVRKRGRRGHRAPGRRAAERWRPADDRGHGPRRDPRGPGGDPGDRSPARRGGPRRRRPLARRRRPPRPRHRQRHELPLVASPSATLYRRHAGRGRSRRRRR